MRIAVFNQKGGVGKTTTALNLAAAVARSDTQDEKNVLLIDLDPQAHLSAIHGQALGHVDKSIYAHYLNNVPLRTLEVAWAGIGTLIPAHTELIKVDSLFGKGPNILNKLSQGLADPASAYVDRAVVIDCCPFLGVLSLNAVFAADRMLVPVSSDFLSLRGALQIDHTLKALEPVLRRHIPRRYLLTRFDRRRKMAYEVYRRLKEQFGSDVCETVISENVAVAEAPSLGKDVFSHDAQCRGAGDYAQLRDELADAGFLTNSDQRLSKLMTCS